MDERHRVLIADSYPDEAEQLKKELSGKYNVISVRDNGVDTLDDIIKLKPDLVVIDLMLSEIDGIGVIEKCRELIEPDKIPAFIALTMLENRELMECIRRLKVDYCMMKPFQAGILAERISQMIRIRSVNNDIQKNKDNDKLVVLLSGGPRRIYHDILDIIDGGDDKLKLQDSDTFIVASPVLPGTEKIANRAINELYKTDTHIHVLKNKELQSMHASEEDIKVLIQILNPKYFVPIKGEYQHFIAASDVAKKMNINDDHIAIVDNGEMITFKDGKLQSYRDSITIEDVMIDGLGIGDVGVKVIDDRNQLQNDGVVIIGMTIDGKTREIVANTDVQTRGFIYLKDSENVVKGIMNIAETELESYKNKTEEDIRDVRQNIKDKVNKYIIKETGKRPVILPVIIEL